MDDWMDRQKTDHDERPRGPRTALTDGLEDKPRRMKVFHETYSIFRPWGSCYRCKETVKEKPEILPDNNDYVCPHTRHTEYLSLMNRLRNAGPSGPWKLQAREFSNDRGEIYVTIAWEEPEDFQNETKSRPRNVPRL